MVDGAGRGGGIEGVMVGTRVWVCIEDLINGIKKRGWLSREVVWADGPDKDDVQVVRSAERSGSRLAPRWCVLFYPGVKVPYQR